MSIQTFPGTTSLIPSPSAGVAGQFLQTDGIVTLSWATVTTVTPGGSNTHVQFNDSSSFGGSAQFTFAKTTGTLTLAPTARTSGSPNTFVITGSADTTLAASTEAIDINFNLARTVQFATGALTTQRAVVIQAPTYAFVGVSTLTNADTVVITGKPAAGTNATISGSTALRIPVAAQASANVGVVSIGNGAWDGSSSGKFGGSGNGTVLAINAATGFNGSVADFQIGGVSNFRVDTSSVLVAGYTIRTSNSITAAYGQTSYFYGNHTSGVDTVFLNNQTRTATSGTLTEVEITVSNAASSGTGVFNALLVDPTYNQTGTATGVTRGIFINPTITSAKDHRAQEITFTVAGSLSSSSIYGQKIAITNNQATNANTVYGQYISFTDAGSVANTIYGQYIDVTTANGSDTTIAGYYAGGNMQFADAVNVVLGTSTGTKIGTATTQKLGFFNATPVVQPAAYTPTNVTTDRSYDADATTLAELADVVGTLIADLQSLGLVG